MGLDTNGFNSFADMLASLPDEIACREYLELLRWNGEPTCPHCGFKDPYKLKTKGVFKGLYKCNNCRERFTVTLGTIFEGSHIPIRKWLIGAYLFSAHKKGVSSLQLGRDLGLTQKTAWFMLHRLRYAFSSGTLDLPMGGNGGIVEIDETYVGGKNKNRHANKKVRYDMGEQEKWAVMGFLERDGKIVTRVIPNVYLETMREQIYSIVSKDAHVVTDAHNCYRALGQIYTHTIVKSQEGSYKTDRHFNTNNIEGYWALLKRSIYGIYHSVSPKHLQRYCEEIQYRYNERKITDKERFDVTLRQSENIRLKYKDLIRKS